ncbi:MAG: N-acetylglutaminylglutamine amidotransferase [Chromatiales bacterium]|nr:N-acetylglutaminylglutamine amidotransferase [Chromatiales bacterium]
MCGIAGEIRFDGQAADIAAVGRMTRLQQARGPDGEGLHAAGHVALGHRRLRIIDLSERGAQPMEDEALGLVIVFNGCIYNYPALRRELEQRGHRFVSTSDTEVILKAYAEWGHRCLERFNGMFAFAIHEKASGRVFVARDRLGIKPCYYAECPGVFRFASTLPALASALESPGSLDTVALHHYLSFHSIVPAPRTILQGIRKLPPATWMLIHPDGRREEQRWWEPEFRHAQADGFNELRDELLETLDRAVQRRMVADVPVGVLLSGGVDSSLVVGLLARNGADGLNTFTVGFESAGGEAGNEYPYSDLIAREFGTRHHKIEVSSSQLLENLPDCFRAMSEPMVSHDNIGFYLLSQEVARHVKVVQSGQGADEVFGGYFWYPPLLASQSPVDDYARVFFDRHHDEMADVLDARFVDDDHSRTFVRDWFSTAQAELAVDKALHIDTLVMLVDDPVKRVDNMTMAAGLEARVPFLDYELVEMAARIPPEMKVSGGGKHILKEAARSVIPSEVIDRPKGYFPVPELKYLDGPVLEMVADALGSRAARERGLFQPKHVAELLAEPQAHLTPLQGSKLWQLGSLEIWLQTHGF